MKYPGFSVVVNCKFVWKFDRRTSKLRPCLPVVRICVWRRALRSLKFLNATSPLIPIKLWRVLVERVEGFNSEADWMRGYHEINEFEEQLVTNGAIVVKFWLAITLEEQLKRFRQREKIPFKQFKITPDDWRNRKKWPQYQQAVSDMIERTSTEIAPWKLVAGNDKLFARVEVLKTLVTTLDTAL